MGNPNPVRRRRGRPKTVNLDWNNREAVLAYYREQNRIQKQRRQQREAAEAEAADDGDIVWGASAAAALWGLKRLQFYHKAKKLPGVLKVAGTWCASRRARDQAFTTTTTPTTDTA
jgi:hypothetical protein